MISGIFRNQAALQSGILVFTGFLRIFVSGRLKIHFRNLPESTASGTSLDSAFRKNPEIAKAKNPAKRALSLPIPEESGNATAVAVADTMLANALCAPTQPRPCALPSTALIPNTDDADNDHDHVDDADDDGDHYDDTEHDHDDDNDHHYGDLNQHA